MFILQHPFVSLLRASPTTTWPLIACEVERFVASGDVDAVAPVLLFVFCNPHQEPIL
jgi:hypothetical protein